MKTAIAHLKSTSAYSQSRHYEREVPKLEKERPDAYEERTWRNRVHADELGRISIPSTAFKNCLSSIARYLGEQIPGKGKSTFTKHFEAGVLCLDRVILPIKKADVKGEWLFVPADGKRGSGKRVWKCFPLIEEWEGKVTFTILDDSITEAVFKHHLEQAGKFIGLGRFRPANNGYYGRFSLTKLEWQVAE